VAIATAVVTPGTLAAEIAGTPAMPVNVVLEHASGSVSVRLEPGKNGGAPTAYAVRTARRIFEGTIIVSIPDAPVRDA
jgi:2-methylaconitate cis-trans-isomerase PrpF